MASKTKKKAFKTTRFFVLADAHGIETFTPDKSNFTFMAMRAECNRQRHAVAFAVDFKDEEALTIVKELLAKEDWKKALTALKVAHKMSAADILLASQDQQVIDSHKESLELIPNDKLDPYWG